MDTYQQITEGIVAALEEAAQNGTGAPWQKPWRESGVMPYNPVTGTTYTGINRLILMLAGGGAFATFKQVAERKGKIRKGAKGLAVCYFGTGTKETEENDEGVKAQSSYGFLKRYYVFRWSDVEGLENPAPRGIMVSERDLNQRGEAILATYRARIGAPSFALDSMTGAFYMPATDMVHVPAIGTFRDSESYYGTLFHEMAHSTGHASRLARLDPSSAGARCGEEYGKEELVAELTACFLAHEAQIDLPIKENQTAYLRSWLGTIRAEPRMLLGAASAAQKAADYILGR